MPPEIPEIKQKKQWELPYSQKITRVINAFSLTEKVLFYTFIVIFAVSAIFLLSQVNRAFMVEVPDYGGSLTEGIVGTPRFVNPLLATSDIDRDLSTLVYSGLLKVGQDGNLVPDLAASYDISEDGLTYTVTLKDNVYFHDDTKVTTDDILFTIQTAQDPTLKSPRKTNWDGVVVNKVDDKTITFTLKQAYSPFIQNLTLGILPKHIWKTATMEEFPFSQFNLKPVGTGPYKIDSITYTSGGLPSEYRLTSHAKYALGKPYITTLTVKAYQNQKDLADAYENGDVESLYGISPKQLQTLPIPQNDIILSPLPRVFGVFFNQNISPVLVYKEVRQALNIATDKQAIVDQILSGYGEPIDEPVPPKTLASSASEESIASSTNRIDEAKALLAKNGWKQNDEGIFEKTDSKKNVTRLSFSISTGDAAELKDTAYLLQKQWQALGAEVDVKIFEIGDLNQNVIRARKYDALLFGEIIGRDLDLYPFWHSSQRNDPGLNIALYANVKADKILENIRKTTGVREQETLYNDFSKEIINDMPAVFTYSPYFIYIIPEKVHNVKLGTLTTASERWGNIGNWYIETNNVWKIFTK
jgi:peptide/nickel transport system substrate-binding protein